jgi:hypothetical protein
MLRTICLFAFATLACSRSRSTDPVWSREGRVAGQLVATWSDSGNRVSFAAPAREGWCARDTLLEILAVRNDSGVGLALYAQDSVRAEGYPVMRPGIFAPWRPQATASVRLLSSNALRGFESTGGQVTVTSSGGSGDTQQVSGRFDFLVQLTTGGQDTLRLSGEFYQLPIVSEPASCGRANKPGPR